MCTKAKTGGSGVRLAVLCFALTATSPDTGYANSTDSHVFTLYIRGFKAGMISTYTNKTSTHYATSGAMQPTAFLRKLRDVGYTGSVRGTYSGLNFKPSNYTGETKTGSRHSQVAMRFSRGKPIADSYLPEREKRDYDINPVDQNSTVDPLTAAYSIFTNSPVRSLCNRSVQMFDGRRRSRLTVASPRPGPDGLTCQGTYTRIAGFSPAAMQKRVNFPFTLVYDQLDDGTYQLISFSTTTTFGTARAERR
ncbi:MAG: DUF3108 domain-containing protein [Rhodobacteraceae bacterium]|nr:DUF3108 domain-containing protein [Paracoccaceae bacterium]